MRKLQIGLSFQSAILKPFYIACSGGNTISCSLFYFFLKPLKLSVFAIIFLLAIDGSAQVIPDDRNAILQTNILQFIGFQHWVLSLETRTANPRQTNNFTLGYYEFFKNYRKGAYALYERKFYIAPLTDNFHFFGSAYGQVLYRDIQKEAGLLFPSRYFESVSIVGGGNIGFQSILLKRLSLGCSVGPGVGAVIWQRSYTGDVASPLHITGQAMFLIGLVF